jgi:hypothetical protein
VSSKGSLIEVLLVWVSIYQAYRPKSDKNIDTDTEVDVVPAFGGGFVPPGMEAKAVAVVAARRAAESASERKVRDMIKAPGRRCAPESVTKVQRSVIVELPQEYR